MSEDLKNQIYNGDYEQGFAEGMITVLKLHYQSHEDLLQVSDSYSITYVEGALLTLKAFCEKYLPLHGIDSPVDISKLIEVNDRLIAAKANKFRENENLGHLVYFLWLFGCSKKQAYESVSHYFRCSETKVKSAASIIFKHPDDSIISLLGAEEVLQFLAQFDNSSFPKDKKSHTKALNAYEGILQFTQSINGIGINFPAEVFEPKMPKYSAIYEIIKKDFPVLLERGQFEFDQSK